MNDRIKPRMFFFSVTCLSFVGLMTGSGCQEQNRMVEETDRFSFQDMADMARGDGGASEEDEQVSELKEIK